MQDLNSFKNLVVAVDGSEFSRNAFEVLFIFIFKKFKFKKCKYFKKLKLILKYILIN